ncbi:hypothetical protein CP532_5730 [Ophiocordyceps camponoti-leonardi (nom. inval.)]|nr:hypothetical protein CP532_5730 [Ophiocordyceps camponoti-leonardi (nom. inval.)]
MYIHSNATHVIRHFLLSLAASVVVGARRLPWRVRGVGDRDGWRDQSQARCPAVATVYSFVGAREKKSTQQGKHLFCIPLNISVHTRTDTCRLPHLCIIASQRRKKKLKPACLSKSTKRNSLTTPVSNRPATGIEAIHTLFAWPPFVSSQHSDPIALLRRTGQPVSDPESSPSSDAKMPPGRLARQRLVSNENDENSSTRITRAKAAALSVDELAMPTKGPLQPKKSAANANTGAQRKRAALGDVSNTTKIDVADGKKAPSAAAAAAAAAAPAKVGLVSKAAHPTGVQKSSTRPASRAAPVPKDAVRTEKRTGSGAGALAAGPKRKVPSASSTAAAAKAKAKDDSTAAEEVEPARKKAHTLAAEKPLPSEQETSVAAKAPSPEADLPAQAAPTTKAKRHFSQLDKEDVDDPLMVAEYANEIFEYLRDLEVKSIPNPQYMSHQDDLEWKTRGILIDWLIEVHTRFHLLPETLFLAVNIIDRFLSEKVVQLERLQLVGITAMFIASKYEEVLSPHVENFKRIADNGFSEAEILSAERFVLSTLNYDLSYPNPMNFLRRVSKADNYDIQSRTIGKYLVEISLLDHRFMAYRPSHCAAAAMYLARLMLDRGEWDGTLEHYSGYTEEEIEPAVELMVDYLARPVVHEAFFKKQSLAKDRFSTYFANLKSQPYTDPNSSRGAGNPEKPNVKFSTELKGHGASVEKVAFNPVKDAELCSVSSDGVVKFWDVRTKACFNEVKNLGEALSLIWAPDGETLLVGNKEDMIFVLSPSQPVPLSSHQQSVQTNQISFCWTGERILAATSEGNARILGYPDFEPFFHHPHGSGQEFQLQGHTSSCLTIELSPTAKYIATGGSDSIISLWDTEDLICQRTISSLAGPVRSISFTWDGSYIVGGTDEGSGLEVHHVETGDLVHTFKTAGSSPVVAWAPLRYCLAYSDLGVLRIVGLDVDRK